MPFSEPLAHTHLGDLPTTAATLNFMLLLTTGLLTGLSHCVGMCGPLVGAFVVHQRKQQADVTTALLTYQLGRLTTYVVLGWGAGALGSALYLVAGGPGWQGGLSIGLGLFMLLAGLNLLGWWPRHWPLLPSRWGARVNAALRRLLPKPHPAANFALGVSNGLLPCGSVYAMLLLAATSGGALRGALTLFLFGLGTLPALLGVGLFAAQASVRLRSQLYRVAAVLVCCVGLQLTLRGLALTQHVAHFSIAGVALW